MLSFPCEMFTVSSSVHSRKLSITSHIIEFVCLAHLTFIFVLLFFIVFVSLFLFIISAIGGIVYSYDSNYFFRSWVNTIHLNEFNCIRLLFIKHLVQVSSGNYSHQYTIIMWAENAFPVGISHYSFILSKYILSIISIISFHILLLFLKKKFLCFSIKRYHKKKIIIHVPVKKQHHKHTHTQVKNIHHHHKPIVIKEEKVIKEIVKKQPIPIKIKEEISHDHFRN